MTDISIVIPAKDEEESIAELCTWITTVLSHTQLVYEIIFIDDGSRDHTWQNIVNMRYKHPQVKGVRFNRNFGKSAALHMGFKLAQGEVVITMDADLQDSPE